jgi:hypothetical protein
VALVSARAPKLRRALTGANEAGQAYVVIDGDIPHDACEIDEVRKAASQHVGPYPATFEPAGPDRRRAARVA